MDQEPDLQFLRKLAEDFVGGPILGSFFTVFLYGLLVMQVLTYMSSDHPDPLYIRTLVAWIFALGSIATGAGIAHAYQIGVRSFGNAEAILIAYPSSLTVISVLGLSGPTAQSFYGFRIWKLTRQLYVPILLWLLALSQIGICAYIVYRVAVLLDYRKYYLFMDEVNAWVSLSVAADCLMSVVQVGYLYMRRTGLRQTDTLLTRLSILILQTGAVTSIFAILTLALFRYSSTHSKATYLLITFPTSILYANCVMSNLNARLKHRQSTEPISIPSQAHSFHRNRIHVATDTLTTHDIELGPTTGTTGAQSPVSGRKACPRPLSSNTVLASRKSLEYSGEEHFHDSDVGDGERIRKGDVLADIEPEREVRWETDQEDDQQPHAI